MSAYTNIFKCHTEDKLCEREWTIQCSYMQDANKVWNHLFLKERLKFCLMEFQNITGKQNFNNHPFTISRIEVLKLYIAIIYPNILINKTFVLAN